MCGVMRTLRRVSPKPVCERPEALRFTPRPWLCPAGRPFSSRGHSGPAALRAASCSVGSVSRVRRTGRRGEWVGAGHLVPGALGHVARPAGGDPAGVPATGQVFQQVPWKLPVTLDSGVRAGPGSISNGFSLWGAIHRLSLSLSLNNSFTHLLHFSGIQNEVLNVIFKRPLRF